MIELVIEQRSAAILAASKWDACFPSRSAAWWVPSCSSITWARSDFAPGIPRARSMCDPQSAQSGLSTVTYLFDGEVMPSRQAWGSDTGRFGPGPRSTG